MIIEKNYVWKMKNVYFKILETLEQSFDLVLPLNAFPQKKTGTADILDVIL